MLVPPDYQLPHYHMSNCGFDVPPLSEGVELRDLITQRRVL
jgi:hypothetical protein